VLFNYPLLSIFDRPSEVFGIPLIFAYVFFAWASGHRRDGLGHRRPFQVGGRRCSKHRS
jgi:hypothetical protein